MSKSKIQSFEEELDNSLHALPSLEYDGEECLSHTADMIELCYSQHKVEMASHLKRGLKVLAPFFIDNPNPRKTDLPQLFRDLFFAGHYFMLREYLYYTYNSQDSFYWHFDNLNVDIKFNDKTIPKQFFLQANNLVTISTDLFSNYETSEQIKELLVGQDEFSPSPKTETAFDYISQEIDIKLGAYFNFLDPTDSVDLGGYTYAEFNKVFKTLLLQALFHRYYAAANGTGGPIYINYNDLVSTLNKNTGLSETVCSKILNEITYSTYTKNSRIQPMYFSLYKLERAEKIIMMPHDFATWEGYINILRIVALRRPQLFLNTISTRLGNSLVDAIEQMFAEQGFRCEKNVQLSRFNTQLPDIDLLVVSEEPTLGYVVFICEIKNPVPPQWAKDHLRVLNEDSISKAFQQIAAIKDFLLTSEGINFIKSKLPEEGLPSFGNNFIILPKFLIITSKNAGMFFGDREQIVLNYETLGRILKRCDGDMHYLLTVFGNINNWIDECLEVYSTHCEVNGKTISYEVVKIGRLLDFGQNEYKSKNIDKELLEQFIEEGAHPHDILTKYKFEGED